MQDLLCLLLVFVQCVWLVSTLTCKCDKYERRRIVAYAVSAVSAALAAGVMFVPGSTPLRLATAGAVALHAAATLWYALGLASCGCPASSYVGYLSSAASVASLVPMVLAVTKGHRDAAPPLGGDVVHVRYISDPVAMTHEMGLRDLPGPKSADAARSTLSKWYSSNATVVPAVLPETSVRIVGGAGPHNSFVV